MKKIFTLTICVIALTCCTKFELDSVSGTEDEYVTVSFSPVLTGYDGRTKSTTDGRIDQVLSLLDSIPWYTEYSITMTLDSLHNKKYETTGTITYEVPDSIWTNGGTIRVVKGYYTISANANNVETVVTDKKIASFDPFAVSLVDNNDINIKLKSKVSALFFENKYNKYVELHKRYRTDSNHYSGVIDKINSSDSTIVSTYYVWGSGSLGYKYNVFHSTEYTIILVYDTNYNKNSGTIIKTVAVSSENEKVTLPYTVTKLETGKLYDIGINEDISKNATFSVTDPESFVEGQL